jgi:hypothetical protein
MVARRQYPAASLVKARDAFTVSLAQTIASINREEPELVDVRRVENTQDFVVAFSVRFAIARRDFVTPEQSEMVTQ